MSAFDTSMLKPLLTRKAKKYIETSSSVVYPSESNALPGHADTDSRDSNFSYADAEKLAEMLIEQSRRSKSGFFKQDRPRRPIHIRRSFSDGCLLNDGFEAPASTPDTLFLSRYPSTKSTLSTQHSCIEMDSYASNISLAPTCSTTAETDAQQHFILSQKSTESTEPADVDNSDTKTIRNEARFIPPLPRSPSFSFGSNLMQAKKWGRDVLQEIKAPLRRQKIRQGKQPALDVGYLPWARVAGSEVAREPIDMSFTRPSSSQQFQNTKFQGGTGPPKYLSEHILNKLDEVDREQARIKKELVRLEKRKEELLKLAHAEEKDAMIKEKQRMDAKELRKMKDGKSSNLVKSTRKTTILPRQFSM